MASGAPGLVELADDNGWITDAGDPDFFGDWRVSAISPSGEMMTIVSDDTGKLLGCYYQDRRGRNWRTERIMVAQQWIRETSGVIDFDAI